MMIGGTGAELYNAVHDGIGTVVNEPSMKTSRWYAQLNVSEISCKKFYKH